MRFTSGNTPLDVFVWFVQSFIIYFVFLFLSSFNVRTYTPVNNWQVLFPYFVLHCLLVFWAVVCCQLAKHLSFSFLGSSLLSARNSVVMCSHQKVCLCRKESGARPRRTSVAQPRAAPSLTAWTWLVHTAVTWTLPKWLPSSSALCWRFSWWC